MSTGSAEGLRALGGAASCAVPPREQGRSSHLSRASRAGAGQTLPGQGKELWRGGRGRWGSGCLLSEDYGRREGQES